VSFFADPQNLILIAAAMVSGGLLVWPLVKGSGSTTVNTAEAVRLINREKGVLIDVSEPAEYAAGHASGARNIPFGQVEGSKDLPSNKALPLLLLCPTGARAGRAAGLLRKAGYEKAVAVLGGTAGWREAALPVDKQVEKAEKAEKGRDKPRDKAADKPADKPAEKTADSAPEQSPAP
jgi:rhodanese-related sulfurtransferase